MKTLKLFFVAIALLGTTGLFATNTLTDSKNEIQKEITQLLEKPDFALSDDVIEVEVTFFVDSEGKIVVTSIDSFNREINDYVKKSLNQKSISAKTVRPGIMYVLPVKIKKA